ncbi:AAA family ATPase, partial [Bacteroidales bacterium OttesenSCG-928-E04]|nr:AAA family ATPase [Bacteroidales bacterium OttesenSCG-928-E04]
MSNNSNSTVDAILHIASAYSKEIMNDSIYPAHILKALLHKDIGLISFIEQDLDKDYYYLRDWADMQMLSYPKITRSVSDPELSSDALATLSEADDFRLKLEDDEITPIHILLALVTPGVGFTFEQLKTFPLTADEILSQINRTVSTPQPGKPASSGGSSSKKNSAISKYTINKNEKLQDENQWEIVGFEKELQIMFETFGRKNKSNVLLVGESGVGKTALINAFVQRINKGEVPVFLEDITVYEVDLTAISSEANYKGEVEDRMKKLLSELAENSRNILVIENIDKVFDKNSILSGVSNLLKKELGQNQ